MSPRLLAALIFVAVLALLMLSNSLYGTTYDEPIYAGKALAAAQWLGYLFQSPADAVSAETIRQSWDAKDQHPGFYKLLAGVSAVTLGTLTPASALRVGTNLLVAAACAALVLLVADAFGRGAAVYAALALLLMPRVFGDAHMGALDAPIMSMSVLVLAAVWRVCVPRGEIASPRETAFWTLLAGLLWGLALGTKLNAFFLPFIVFPWVLLADRRRFWPLALSFAVLGPLAFWGTWPWLWHDTLPRFMEYFHFHFKHWEIGVTYFGRVYTLAPWHYPLVMILITLPPVTLALSLLGLGTLPSASRGLHSTGLARRRALLLTLVGWGLLVNLIPSCLPSTPKYNGVRLFLPVFALLAVFAAAGFRAVLDGGLRLVQRRTGQAAVIPARAVALVVVIALLGPLMATGKFTPFHLSYYNALIGGLPGAVRAGMEPTYWGDVYRSAALWLSANAPRGARVWVEPAGYESTFRLFELGPLRDDLTFSAGPEGLAGSDFAVTQNKSTEFTPDTRRMVATMKPVFTDGLDGVPLVYVFRLR